jgi:hypothetical protein
MRGIERSVRLPSEIKDAPQRLIEIPPAGRVPKEEHCP